jgi:hypothetical protein
MNATSFQNNFSLESFSPETRVWIYQADRNLNEFEVLQIENILKSFAQQWTAHQMPLKAATEVRFNRFIIFYVDETGNEISGCGIDKSVQLVKQIEQKLNLNFFDRLKIAYVHENEIKTFLMHDAQKLFNEKILSATTIIFNNLVNSKQEVETKWQIELQQSWLWNRLKTA